MRIPLHATDVDALIKKRLVEGSLREDHDPLQMAICDLIYVALHEPA
jgi:hypothetical protein